MAKIVLNKNWGGFGIVNDEEARDFLRKYQDYEDYELRMAPELIAFVEQNKGNLDKIDDLAIAIVPDNFTDILITEYDGWETAYAVVDGKIVCAEVDEDDEWED
jgi:hypothetical protein